MSKSERYVSIDVETNGAAPGVHSMIALGAAAFDPGVSDNTPVGTFYRKLFPVEGMREHPDTMAWWKTQPQAWEEVCKDRQAAIPVMHDFGLWCDEVSGDGDYRLVGVAWPAAFDFAFVSYYCHRFLGLNPLGFQCVDIRSYANGLARHCAYFGLPQKKTRAMTGEVDTAGLRDHVAVDDAIGQGRLFMALRRHAASLPAVDIGQ